MRGRSAAKPLLVFMLLAAVAIAVIAHRIHVDRPAHYGIENWDLYRYIHPTAVFLGHELARGNLPLWNPYQYAGQPLLALPNAQLLYPPHLALLLVLQPAQALEAEFVLHLLIAGWFTWLLAGRLGLGAAARLAAALGYMLSGPLLFDFYMLPLICSEAWLPAILWAVHGLASEARPRWALALAGCLALAFLGGYPQGFLYEVQIAERLRRLRALRRGAAHHARPGGRPRAARRRARVRPRRAPAAAGDRAGRAGVARLRRPSPLRRGGGIGVLRGSCSRECSGSSGRTPRLFPGPMRRYLTLPVLALPLAALAWMARRQRWHCAFFSALRS